LQQIAHFRLYFFRAGVNLWRRKVDTFNTEVNGELADLFCTPFPIGVGEAPVSDGLFELMQIRHL
jgi:hypothetical protein